MLGLDAVKKTDPQIYDLIIKELHRQQNGLELIASENFTSIAVQEAMGTVLTNKYAEGLPEKRYYGGCEYVDGVEQLAIDRLKELFGCDHANVQPHSGAQANMAAFLAAGLKPGDTIMGQDLKRRPPHPWLPRQLLGMFYNVAPYKVNPETGRLDMDKVRETAIQAKPKLIICGTSAYARTIDFEAFRKIADEVGAILMADIAHIAGLVVAGEHPSPVPYAEIVTTTTHKTLRGPRGGVIMCRGDFAKAVDKAVFPGLQGGPLMHVIAAKAVAFKEALSDDFKQYARQVVLNARTLGQTLMEEGMDLVSGGTDTHLVLVDLRNRNLTGKEASAILDGISITANKNTVPEDPQSPFVTSGLRLGTPAVTSRGMKEVGSREIAHVIAEALARPAQAAGLKERVTKLTKEYPLYPELNLAQVP